MVQFFVFELGCDCQMVGNVFCDWCIVGSAVFSGDRCNVGGAILGGPVIVPCFCFCELSSPVIVVWCCRVLRARKTPG